MCGDESTGAWQNWREPHVGCPVLCAVPPDADAGAPDGPRFPKGHRRKLELGVPNEIAFDRRRDEHVVLRFLEERGFITAAGGPPTPPTPRTSQLGLWG